MIELEKPLDKPEQNVEVSIKSIGISDVRDTNRQIVLRSIWRLQPISRAEVARLTRISKSAISSIVNGLIEEGIVRETAADTTQIGRTPIYLRLNEKKFHFFAVDIRIRGVNLAVYDLAGEQVAESRLSIRPVSTSPRRLIEAASAELYALAKKHRVPVRSIRAVGISVPGQANHESGMVLNAPRIGWKDIDLNELIGAHMSRKLDVVVDNSANHALRAEVWRAHSVQENITGVYVDINESVESGIILDGKILKAAPYGMGSFGRMRIAAPSSGSSRLNPPVWEDLVSVESMLDRFTAGKKKKSGAIRDQLLELRTAYERGDARATEIVEETAHWLAVGISNIFVSLGFPHVIVGGYIRLVWDLVQEQVFRECDSLTEHEFPGAREIRLSGLSRHETLEGAGLGAVGTVIPLELLSQLTVEQKEIIESRVL